MPTVSEEVICPRCGGVAIEDFDCRIYQASYACMSCGYHARVGEREEDDLSLEDVPESLRLFSEWVQVEERHGWVCVGRVLMAPGVSMVVTRFSVVPDHKGGQLVWLYYRIETIPPDEQPQYPCPEGGYYQFRDARPPKEFASFSEAWEYGMSLQEEVEDG